MPEAQPSRPRLYTIPPSAPFLTSLARAVLAGDLPIPGGVAPDPLALPRATLYLPTRRAARALREAFLAAAGGRATLLPRIRALGDPDEDAALIFGTEAGAEHDFEGSRRGARSGIAGAETCTDASRPGLEPNAPGRGDHATSTACAVPLVATPAQASYLAADLARLMDFIESEEVNLAALEGLMPDEYAEHWQLTLDFLDIVTEHWPQHLRDQGLVSPVARRNVLMAMEADAAPDHGSTGPVIAAGSTGTVPATARLLQTIASLPNGAVVLPGLDLSLDAASWKSLGEHPEHPQFALAKLLAMLGSGARGGRLCSRQRARCIHARAAHARKRGAAAGRRAPSFGNDFSTMTGLRQRTRDETQANCQCARRHPCRHRADRPWTKPKPSP